MAEVVPAGPGAAVGTFLPAWRQPLEDDQPPSNACRKVDGEGWLPTSDELGVCSHQGVAVAAESLVTAVPKLLKQLLSSQLPAIL